MISDQGVKWRRDSSLRREGVSIKALRRCARRDDDWF